MSDKGQHKTSVIDLILGAKQRLESAVKNVDPMDDTKVDPNEWHMARVACTRLDQALAALESSKGFVDHA